MIDNKRILKTGVLAAVMTIVFAIFAFRASEWTNSVSSEFLVYGAASSSGGGTTGGGGGTTGGTGGTTTKVVAQIAAGAYDSATHYGTVIEIINPSSSAITISGNFYNEDGSASTLSYANNLSSTPFVGSFSNVNLAASSILVLSTGTSTGTTPSAGTTNWAKFTASNTISVASFFELRHRGDEALYSRVGIPSSRPDMTSFVIPRVREKQADGSGLADIETGFAIVNTGSITATVTAKVIDANGNIIAATTFILKTGQHKVGIVNSAFAIQGETTGRQYHYVMFSSDQPTIGAAALAFEGGSLTSFPVDPIS